MHDQLGVETYPPVLAVVVMSPESAQQPLGDGGGAYRKRVRETVRSVLTQTVPPALLLLVDTTPGSDAGASLPKPVDPAEFDARVGARSRLGLSGGAPTDARAGLSGGPSHNDDEGRTHQAGNDGVATRIYRVAAPGAENFGRAVRTALSRPLPGGQRPQAEWLWLLHDDVRAAPDALQEMLSLGVATDSIAALGPKQVKYGQQDRLLELGIHATRRAQRVEDTEPDEIDQGQYDDREDVLAVGTAGILVRASAWEEVGGIDPALGPFGDGLEFSRRLHLAGYRVVVAPAAVLEHAQSSFRGTNTHSSFAHRRAAQLYNWALATPGLLLPFLLFWLPFLTAGRALGRLATGKPRLVWPEIQALLLFVVVAPRLVPARARLARVSRVPRSSLAGLEASPANVRSGKRSQRRIAARGTVKEKAADQGALNALRRHRVAGSLTLAGLVLAAFLLSTSAFYPYASGAIGGRWAQLPHQWGTLWDQAWSGWLVSGDGASGPAQMLLVAVSLLSAPFAAFGVSPHDLGVALLFLALPAAVLVGWLLAGTFTHSTAVKAGVAAAWAATGAMLGPLIEGDGAQVTGYLALGLLVTGLVRGFCAPLPLIARSVDDMSRVANPDRTAWAAVGALALILLAPAFPLALPLAVVAAFLLAALSRAGMARAQRILLVLIAVLPALVVYLPALVSRVAGSSPQSLWAWAAPLTTGSPWYALVAGFPSNLPTALPGQSTFEAMQAGTYPFALSWAAFLAGWALVLWATAVFMFRGMRVPSQTKAEVAVWFAAIASLATVFLLETFTPGAPWVLYACAMTLFGVGVAQGYAGASLPADAHTYARQVKRVRRLRGLPSALALVAALVSMGVVILGGPVGSIRPLPDGDPTPGADHVELEGEVTADEQDEGRFGLFTGADQAYIQPAEVPLTPHIAQESQSSGRAARTLAVRAGVDSTRALLLRGDGLQLADLGAPERVSEVGQAARTDLEGAVGTLMLRPSSTVARTLADHAVDVVLVSEEQPDLSDVRATVDASPGLERIGEVSGSAIWRVRPDGQTPARATVTLEDGERLILDSGPVKVRATYDQDQPGVLHLSEVADPAWVASLDGKPLEALEPDTVDGEWRQAFQVPAGKGVLKVDYRPGYLVWWWTAAAVVGLATVAALVPFRRRSPQVELLRDKGQETTSPVQGATR